MENLKSVTVFLNGMVAVFDAAGQQVPELQGKWSEVHEAVIARADEGTRFHLMDYKKRHARIITREEWLDYGKHITEHPGTRRPWNGRSCQLPYL